MSAQLPDTREAQILRMLTEHPAGLSHGVLASALGITQGNVRTQISRLGPMICSWKQGRQTYVSLSAEEIETRWEELARATQPQQPLPCTLSPETYAAGPTGDLGAARKILAGLSTKSARTLACAGGYRYGYAEELFGQLRAGGWVS